MDMEAKREKLMSDLWRAERERDVWKGRSQHHYDMACHLVQSIKNQLAKLGDEE